MTTIKPLPKRTAAKVTALFNSFLVAEGAMHRIARHNVAGTDREADDKYEYWKEYRTETAGKLAELGIKVIL